MHFSGEFLYSQTNDGQNLAEKNISTSVSYIACFEPMVRTSLHVAKDYMVLTGLIISCISLVILLVFMILLPRTRQEVSGRILLCHAASLLVANIFLVLNNGFMHNLAQGTCIFFGEW